MIVLRPRAIRHKFRLGTGFTAAKTDSRGWTPSRRPLRYRSQAMEKNAVTVIYGVQKRARYVYAPTSQMRLCRNRLKLTTTLREALSA